jgi:hypothetical protein
MQGVHNAWTVQRMDLPNTKGMVIRTVPLFLLMLAPTQSTREATEGGSNVTKSLRKAVKFIDLAESITQKR